MLEPSPKQQKKSAMNPWKEKMRFFGVEKQKEQEKRRRRLGLLGRGHSSQKSSESVVEETAEPFEEPLPAQAPQKQSPPMNRALSTFRRTGSVTTDSEDGGNTAFSMTTRDQLNNPLFYPATEHKTSKRNISFAKVSEGDFDLTDHSSTRSPSVSDNLEELNVWAAVVSDRIHNTSRASCNASKNSASMKDELFQDSLFHDSVLTETVPEVEEVDDEHEALDLGSVPSDGCTPTRFISTDESLNRSSDSSSFYCHDLNASIHGESLAHNESGDCSPPSISSPYPLRFRDDDEQLEGSNDTQPDRVNLPKLLDDADPHAETSNKEAISSVAEEWHSSLNEIVAELDSTAEHALVASLGPVPIHSAASPIRIHRRNSLQSQLESECERIKLRLQNVKSTSSRAQRRASTSHLPDPEHSALQESVASAMRTGVIVSSYEQRIQQLEVELKRKTVACESLQTILASHVTARLNSSHRQRKEIQVEVPPPPPPLVEPALDPAVYQRALNERDAAWKRAAEFLLQLGDRNKALADLSTKCEQSEAKCQALAQEVALLRQQQARTTRAESNSSMGPFGLRVQHSSSAQSPVRSPRSQRRDIEPTIPTATAIPTATPVPAPPLVAPSPKGLSFRRASIAALNAVSHDSPLGRLRRASATGATRTQDAAQGTTNRRGSLGANTNMRASPRIFRRGSTGGYTGSTPAPNEPQEMFFEMLNSRANLASPRSTRSGSADGGVPQNPIPTPTSRMLRRGSETAAMGAYPPRRMGATTYFKKKAHEVELEAAVWSQMLNRPASENEIVPVQIKRGRRGWMSQGSNPPR